MFLHPISKGNRVFSRQSLRRLIKPLIVMKLTTIFILMACLQVSANSFSQQVTLTEKNAPMEKVFKSIKSQTGYVFFYDADILKRVSPVTLNLKNTPLDEALQMCFKNQPLTYYMIGKTIVVDYKKPDVTDIKSAQQQAAIDISGQVVNEDGEPAVSDFYNPLTASDEAEALNIVFQERRWELPLKGSRWMDMKRLDALDRMLPVERLDPATFDVLETLEPHSPHYTFEIPSRVLYFNPTMQKNF